MKKMFRKALLLIITAGMIGNASVNATAVQDPEPSIFGDSSVAKECENMRKLDEVVEIPQPTFGDDTDDWLFENAILEDEDEDVFAEPEIFDEEEDIAPVTIEEDDPWLDELLAEEAQDPVYYNEDGAETLNALLGNIDITNVPVSPENHNLDNVDGVLVNSEYRIYSAYGHEAANVDALISAIQAADPLLVNTYYANGGYFVLMDLGPRIAGQYVTTELGHGNVLYHHIEIDDNVSSMFAVDHELGHFIDRCYDNDGVYASESPEWLEITAAEFGTSGLDAYFSTPIEFFAESYRQAHVNPNYDDICPRAYAYVTSYGFD